MAKKRFVSNVQIGTAQGPSLWDLRLAAKSDPVAFMSRVNKLVDEGKLKFSQFTDIKALFQALADIQVPIVAEGTAGVKRAIMTSAFPILVGTTAIAAINEAYDAVPTVSEDLVTEMDDSKKVTVIARLATLDAVKDKTKEADDFPEITATEDSVQIGHWRNGRILRITAETIEENNVADIVNRLNTLGELAANFVEEQTLKRVCDYDGSCAAPAEPYVYRPNGTGASLFSATANTPGTRAPSGTRINSNPFVNETDLEAARARLATFLDDNARRIAIPKSDMVLLCPDALISAVLKVKNSEMVPGSVNEYSAWGPRGQWGSWKPISTPKLDDLSSTAWYFGAPKREFRRKWKLNMEYVTLGEQTESYLRARIAFQARVAWDCEIGAIDYVYWVQNLAATTAPKDD